MKTVLVALTLIFATVAAAAALGLALANSHAMVEVSLRDASQSLDLL